MKPHYEIHSLSSTQIVEPAEGESAASHMISRPGCYLLPPKQSLRIRSTARPDARCRIRRCRLPARYQKALLDYVRELAAKMTDMHA